VITAPPSPSSPSSSSGAGALPAWAEPVVEAERAAEAPGGDEPGEPVP
jgi:hypothetical protein